MYIFSLITYTQLYPCNFNIDIIIARSGLDIILMSIAKKWQENLLLQSNSKFCVFQFHPIERLT